MVERDAPGRRRRDLRGPQPGTGPVPTVPTTTGSTAAVQRRSVPPDHRRRWIVLTLLAVVLSVAAVTGGPWLYSRITAGSPPEPLALTTSTAAPSNDPDVPLVLDGTWRATAGSEAGYRIGELVTGKRLEVVGRTQDVAATVTVTGKTLTAATVIVQTVGIATDEAARDIYFRRALDTSTYPTATFTATGPIDLSALATATAPISVEVPGALTIRDKTVDVMATLQVQRTADGLEVVGGITVELKDVGLTAPDPGFVTVDDTGSVEFRLELSR